MIQCVHRQTSYIECNVSPHAVCPSFNLENKNRQKEKKTRTKLDKIKELFEDVALANANIFSTEITERKKEILVMKDRIEKRKEETQTNKVSTK